MQIGNRIFPYPVVNRNEELSDFINGACYKLAFGEPENPIISNRHYLTLKDVHIELVDDTLREFVQNGYMEATLVVESPESVFRKTYSIGLTPITIKVPLIVLSGKVTISSYLYATKDIFEYKSINFNEDFSNIEFELNKFDIVGIDDGFSFNIEHNDLADNVSESIFEIIRGENSQKYIQYNTDEGDSKIYIYLPKEKFEQYSQVKTSRPFMYIFMGLIVVPVLVDIFNRLKNEFRFCEDIIDINESYPWFKSVARSYKSIENMNLSVSTFMNSNTLEFAQKIFNNMNVQAIEDAYNMIINEIEGEQDGEN
jgi:hypothetical protein